jgi:CheY-like chemotaxis protein
MSTPSRPLAALLEGLPAAAYLCDRQGLITYFNPAAAKVWGRHPKLNDSADRYCGSHKLFWIDHEPMTHEQCWMARALREDRPYNGCDVIVQQPGGQLHIAVAHANPMHDETGQLIGALNILVPTETKQKRRNDALRIVVIDTGRETTTLAFVFTAIGHEVRTVSNVLDAVQLAKKFRPNMLFIDVTGQQMDGYQLAGAIRRESWGQPIVLVAIGCNKPRDLEHARTAGFNHHSTKPWNLADILPLLANIAAK